jgi:hypothetical protein
MPVPQVKNHSKQNKSSTRPRAVGPTNDEQWFAKAAFATIALVVMKSCFDGDISNATQEQYEMPSAMTAVAVGTLPKVDRSLQRIALDGSS